MRTIAMAAVLLAMSTVAGAAEVVKKVHPRDRLPRFRHWKNSRAAPDRTTSRCA